jgi:hypothetical protein
VLTDCHSKTSKQLVVCEILQSKKKILNKTSVSEAILMRDITYRQLIEVKIT